MPQSQTLLEGLLASRAAWRASKQMQFSKRMTASEVLAAPLIGITFLKPEVNTICVTDKSRRKALNQQTLNPKI